MKRLLTARIAAYLLFLTLVYALVLASFHPWDLAAGAVLSGVLLFAFRGFLLRKRAGSPGSFPRRFLAFWPFAFATAKAIIEGTWEVTLVTLHFRPLHSPGIVAIPIAERTPLGVAVSALATTLSPGTVLVDVDMERGVMLIHAIDARDPDAIREEHGEFYRRYQSKVFP